MVCEYYLLQTLVGVVSLNVIITAYNAGSLIYYTRMK